MLAMPAGASRGGASSEGGVTGGLDPVPPLDAAAGSVDAGSASSGAILPPHAATATATTGHRLAFEAVLEQTADLPLEEGIARVVDFCFATIIADKRVPRAVLKIAHTVGLMPTVTRSTNVAVGSLARAIRRRTDLKVADPDLAAWVLTHTMMGAVHSLIWEEEPRCATDALRAELVVLYCGYLRGRASSSSEDGAASAAC